MHSFFVLLKITVRALEALEAESQTLKIDLDEIKQQNQAFKDTQEANVHRLYARLNVAKENLRQFVCQCQLNIHFVVVVV